MANSDDRTSAASALLTSDDGVTLATPVIEVETVELVDFLHVGLEPGPGEKHPVAMVNGEFCRTRDLRISPYVHALHYATGIIGGTSGWLNPETDQRNAFRLPDTVLRLIANAKAVGLPGPFPDPLLHQWMLRSDSHQTQWSLLQLPGRCNKVGQ